MAAARRRLNRLRSQREVDRKVLARYEAEVRRLEVWVAGGAPIPPAYVSFAELDPLTQQALLHQLAQDTKDDPDPKGPVEMTDEPATVSLAWPGGIIVHLLVDRLMRELIEPRGPEGQRYRDPQAQADLDVVAHNPGALGVDPTRWNYERAKRWLVLHGLAEAMLYAKKVWTGRIGSGSGSAKVTGIPEAGAIGYAKWLQQEAPKYARAKLRDLAAEITDPSRHDLRAEWEVDLETEALPHLVPEAAEDEGPDWNVIHLAQALLVANPKHRKLLMAESHPERLSLMEDAAELARDTLTAEDRRLLDIECHNDAEIAAAIKDVPLDQIPVLRRRLIQRIAKLTT